MLLYRSEQNMTPTITYCDSPDYGDLIREYQCYVKGPCIYRPLVFRFSIHDIK